MKNNITNLKKTLRGIIPHRFMSLYRDFVGRGRMIDISVIRFIREKDKKYLSNQLLVEKELIPQTGLNNEQIQEFPRELYDFCGKGLLSWQYPSQFSKYLTKVKDFKIKSYFEIGVRHGGTFIFTVEYLNKFNPIVRATGIDIFSCPSLSKYKKINSNIDFIKIDTKSSEFKQYMENQDVFDLVLIDGDHYEAGVRNDINLLKDKANVLVFHDIASDVCPGVKKVWNEFKLSDAGEYNFFEFIDQYDSVKESTKTSYLGIGVAARKKFI